MQFIDLAAQQRRIKDRLDARIRAVLAHGQYVMLGPEMQAEVRELEERLAEYVGVRHAISCASGTDALLLALMAHGVGPGDAVFTTPFTFVAAAEVISLLGATPVFVDIDPTTFNLDPAHLALAIEALNRGDSSICPLPSFRSAIRHPPSNAVVSPPPAPVVPSPVPNLQSAIRNPQSGGAPLSALRSPLVPRGVIAVDLFGLPADYDRINAVAGENGLFVIEDAAQSFGGQYKARRACALAEVACTSFYPTKPLGCYGEGGACFTGNKEIADVMRSLRNHGAGENRYDHVRIGINGRLDTLQAAILLAKLEIFPEELEDRQAVAARYHELLAPCASRLTSPNVPSGRRSAWAQYSVLACDEAHRLALLDRLKAAEIPTAINYRKPLHMQPAFAHLGYQGGDFPVSESTARRIFSLPMHPYLSEGDQRRIAELLLKGA